MLEIVFLIISLLGFCLAYLYGHKSKKFYWSKYWLMLAGPILCALILAYFEGLKIIQLFILSSVVGFSLEYVLGFSYHKIFNSRLWIYERFSVGGYTSFLTLPVWGVAGIVFWFLVKFVSRS